MVSTRYKSTILVLVLCLVTSLFGTPGQAKKAPTTKPHTTHHTTRHSTTHHTTRHSTTHHTTRDSTTHHTTRHSTTHHTTRDPTTHQTTRHSTTHHTTRYSSDPTSNPTTSPADPTTYSGTTAPPANRWCSDHPDICHHHCRNIGNSSYQCYCSQGYKLENDRINCTDIDECDVQDGFCDQNQYCVNTVGSFRCGCLDGYEYRGNTKKCKDINECKTKPCGHMCRNTKGGYKCSCRPGYQLSTDGSSCIKYMLSALGCYEQDDPYEGNWTLANITIKKSDDCILECASANSKLAAVHAGTDCYCGDSLDDVTVTASKKCQSECEEATFGCGGEEAFSVYQIDVDECADNNGGCGQTCDNKIDGFSCSCRHGYQLEVNGKTCEEIPVCDPNPCENGGVCSRLEVASFECNCTDTGYVGKTCNTGVVITPEYPVLQVDTPSTSLNICATTDNGLRITMISDDHLSFTPQFVEITSSETCVEFTVTCSAENLYEVAYRVEGNSTDQFLPPDNSVIVCLTDPNDTQSVFDKLNIDDFTLFKGACETPVYSSNDISVMLFSTSLWKSTSSDPDVIFTTGVTYLKAGSDEYPISVLGCSFNTKTFRVSTSLSDAQQNANDDVVIGTTDCEGVTINVFQLHEFLDKNSFMKSFMKSTSTIIQWLQFIDSGNDIISVNDMASAIKTGSDVITSPHCSRLAVTPSHLFVVFTFGTEFTVKIDNSSEATFLAPSEGDKFCFAVDLFKRSLLFQSPIAYEEPLADFPGFKEVLESNGRADIWTFGFSSLLSMYQSDQNERSLFLGITPDESDFWNGHSRFKYQESFGGYNCVWNGKTSHTFKDKVNGNRKVELKLNGKHILKVDDLATAAPYDWLSKLTEFSLKGDFEIEQSFKLGGEDISVNIKGKNSLIGSLGETNQSLCDDKPVQGIFFTTEAETFNSGQPISVQGFSIKPNEATQVDGFIHLQIENTDDPTKIAAGMIGFGYTFTAATICLKNKCYTNSQVTILVSKELGKCQKYEKMYRESKRKRKRRETSSEPSRVEFCSSEEIELGPGIIASSICESTERVHVVMTDTGSYEIGGMVTYDILGMHGTAPLVMFDDKLCIEQFQGKVAYTFDAVVLICSDVGEDSLNFEIHVNFNNTGDLISGLVDKMNFFSCMIFKHEFEQARMRWETANDNYQATLAPLYAAEEELNQTQAVYDQAKTEFNETEEELEQAMIELSEARKLVQKADELVQQLNDNLDQLCVLKKCKKNYCIAGCRWDQWNYQQSRSNSRAGKKRHRGKKRRRKWVYFPCWWKKSKRSCNKRNANCLAIREKVLQQLNQVVYLLLNRQENAMIAVQVAEITVDKKNMTLEIAATALEISQAKYDDLKFVSDEAKNAVELIENSTEYRFYPRFCDDDKNLRISKASFTKLLSEDSTKINLDLEVTLLNDEDKPFIIMLEEFDIMNVAQVLYSQILKFNSIVAPKLARLLAEQQSHNMRRRSVEERYEITRRSTNDEIPENEDTVNTLDSECKAFTKIEEFVQSALNNLLEQAQSALETTSSLSNTTTSEQIDDPVAENQGINVTFLQEMFNISEQIDASSSKLMTAYKSMSNATGKLGERFLTLVNEQSAVLDWVALESSEFDNDIYTDCFSFQDCIIKYGGQLKSMFDAMLEYPDPDELRTELSSAVEKLQNLVNNTIAMSMSVKQAITSAEEILELFKKLNELNVYCAVDPIITEEPDQLIGVLSGKSLSLRCAASGDPEPNYLWLKDEEKMDPEVTSKTLIFNEITSDNEGEYKCCAYNHAMKTCTRGSTVVIDKVPGIISEGGESTELTAGEGSVTFKCQITGNPIPKITWFQIKNGKSKIGKVLKGKTSNSLTIRKPIGKDKGCYYCVAENRQGKKTSTPSCLKLVSVNIARQFTIIKFKLVQGHNRGRRSVSSQTLEESIMAALLATVELPHGSTMEMSVSESNSVTVFVRSSGLLANETSALTQEELQEKFNTKSQELMNAVTSLKRDLDLGLSVTHDGQIYQITDVTGGDSTSINCPTGQQAHENGFLCVNCAPGSYGILRDGTGHCEKCPVGSYQTTQEQTSCSQCKETQTTKQSGSTREEDCFDVENKKQHIFSDSKNGWKIGLAIGLFAVFLVSVVVLLVYRVRKTHSAKFTEDSFVPRSVKKNSFSMSNPVYVNSEEKVEAVYEELIVK